LEKLPICRDINVDGYKIEVYHGSPWEPLTEYVYPNKMNIEEFSRLQTDCVILGHTHIPLLAFAKGVMIINPGSCGQPRDYIPGACYGMLSIEDRSVELKRASYDIEALMTVLQALNYDPQLVEILNRTNREIIS
jgi:predicted phosphodiesterase